MIKLTALEYDGSIWINPNLITAFEGQVGGTFIYFDQDNLVKVKQRPEHVAELVTRFFTEHTVEAR